MTNETVKFPFSKIIFFLQVAAQYMASIPGAETKAAHAIRQVTQSIQKAQKQRAKDEKKINIDLSETDENGHIVFDKHGNYCYSKKSQTQRMERLSDLDDKEYDIEPFFVEIHKDATAQQIEAFTGFIFRPAQEQAPEVTAEHPALPGKEKE